MGIWSSFKEGFENGREKAKKRSLRSRHMQTRNNIKKNIKLVEPNDGRIVTLEIGAEEPLLHALIKQTKKMAENMNAEKIAIKDNKVTIEFPDAIGADIIRKNF